MATVANELCFVWGPPLCGQWKWMQRAVDATPAGAVAHVLPIYKKSSATLLSETLGALSESLEASQAASSAASTKDVHLYCELPWSIVEEGLELEEWLSQQPVFREPQAQWNLSFVGLCPFHAELLPRSYRLGLEEFSRATQSVIIVAKEPHQNTDPVWLGTELLDFGNRIEVYEEEVWSPPSREVRTQSVPSFSDIEDFELLRLPLYGSFEHARAFLREISRSERSVLWAAELLWKQSSNQMVFESLNAGKIHSWESPHASWGTHLSPGEGQIQVVGTSLELLQWMALLKNQRLN